MISYFRFFLAAACAALGACASEPLPVGNGTYSLDSGYAYRLGPGDKVRVVVFEEDQLSGEFIVGNDGSVALPLIGVVKAGGLTSNGFQQAVEAKLTASGLVKSPRVSTDIISYRPFYVLGEVNKPGQYPYVVGMTVTKAVATAGGFTYRANPQTVYVTREGAASETPVPVTAASWIGPGDTVRIAERLF